MDKNFFSKKTIIITGSNQGLGLEIAKFFALKNSNLILCARNKKKILQSKKYFFKYKKNILFQKLDISKKNQVDKFFKKIFKKFKKIDILINNAGIYGPKGKSEKLSWAEWKKTIEINLLGSIYVINKIIPHFKKNKYGKIIQISGGGAASPFPYFSPYSVSKIGIVRFIENLSMELKNHKIFVNSVAPGPINTRMLEEVLKAGPYVVGKSFFKKSKKQKIDGGTSIKKILELVEFLAHKKSDHISGKLISVLWDNWKIFYKKKKALKHSDIGTLRRITGRDRKIKFFDK